ncbi:MAG: signal peptide peptidase SppA [Anaerolineales bacterium]|nr:signal peptide peptidase SppA [Anaerolineales bacterium]
MKSRGLIITVVVLGVLAIALLVGIGVLVARLAGDASAGLNDAVAIIYVEGPIITGKSVRSSSSAAYSETIVQYLRDAQNNASVKAIVLRVDSPGGSVVASREIYDAVMAARAKGKPIIASFGEIAASGGYYISAGADKIYTQPGTLTGSIGVISVFPSLEGLTDKIGVKVTVVKSGPHKDESYGYRDLSPEERAIWQAMIDEIYGDFVDIVAQGRRLDTARVKKLADGRIYTGKQAKELGLADELGDLDAAVDAAAKLGNISGTPRRIEFRYQPGFWSGLAYSAIPNWDARELADLFALGQWGRVMYLYVAP